MAGSDLVLEGATDGHRVLGWRLEKLERAGYDRLSAWEIAERADVDLHLAVGLRRAGCAPATARRILL
jgi:hypothetical protein